MIAPLPKIKAILAYFANNSNYLGKVKLMKLFYFLDFRHVKRYGTPVTYDTYYRLERGPVPSFIMNLVNSSIENDVSSILKDTVKFVTPAKTNMNKIKPARFFTKEDEAMFLESELEILKEVNMKFKDTKMDKICNESHNESPWKNTQQSQVITYSLAALDSDCKFTAEEIDFAVKLAE